MHIDYMLEAVIYRFRSTICSISACQINSFVVYVLGILIGFNANFLMLLSCGVNSAQFSSFEN